MKTLNLIIGALLFTPFCFAGGGGEDEKTKAQPTVVSSKGEQGRDAHDGAQGRSGSSGGQHGSSGGNASEAGAAQHSGDIVIEMEEVSDGGLRGLRITGQVTGPQAQRVDESIFGDQRQVYLDSQGARGGHGGTGGSGGHGAKGRPGRDATRYSSGSDGGPGGDGGHAGMGSSGAPGGDAGKIDIVLKEKEMHLLMYVDESTDGILSGQISGGAGGNAGEHGNPGRGGAGGDGGSSHTWFTTHTETVSDGKGGTTTRTRTEMHHNPGGWDGPSGRSGRSQTATLRPGRPGRDNKLTIKIKGANGKVQTYTEGRYNLDILDVEFESDSTRGGIVDNIIEPREPVSVWVTVKNAGRMPMPANQEVMVFFTPIRKC